LGSEVGPRLPCRGMRSCTGIGEMSRCRPSLDSPNALSCHIESTQILAHAVGVRSVLDAVKHRRVARQSVFVVEEARAKIGRSIKRLLQGWMRCGLNSQVREARDGICRPAQVLVAHTSWQASVSVAGIVDYLRTRLVRVVVSLPLATVGFIWRIVRMAQRQPMHWFGILGGNKLLVALSGVFPATPHRFCRGPYELVSSHQRPVFRPAPPGAGSLSLL
jgi:hypothetical protein